MLIRADFDYSLDGLGKPDLFQFVSRQTKLSVPRILELGRRGVGQQFYAKGLHGMECRPAGWFDGAMEPQGTYSNQPYWLVSTSH